MREWALANSGHADEGVAELERALADEVRASTIWTAMIGTLLAGIYLRQTRPEAARALLDQVQALSASMPAYYYQPEIDRVEAEWLHVVGRHSEARMLLFGSIDTARRHGSTALAIRSALALCRADSSARETDLALLSDLCGQHPVDNDTDYGRDARALIGVALG